MHWPEWCTDIPAASGLIPAGAPVCSVHAEAASSARARDLAMARRDSMSVQFLRKAA